LDTLCHSLRNFTRGERALEFIWCDEDTHLEFFYWCIAQ
ncbi:MAG: hypothetical protein RJB01_1155, partial [Actinomycetota bacterium]